jgi:hypothetical protein
MRSSQCLTRLPTHQALTQPVHVPGLMVLVVCQLICQPTPRCIPGVGTGRQGAAALATEVGAIISSHYGCQLVDTLLSPALLFISS